ncbi:MULTISPECIES: YceI family protein [Bordetella]|uniref:Polyisoprenoid-binding protein n=1 Tax=Bordetella genomosp. 6 TaxID=463024 RepID=A0ABX4FFC2_9BORD|nr:MULTISPECIES: YceI family protein [Bordetella]AOB28271.1 polyisoprenoid-binding protein [Bordetella bronchiseptica]AZW45612.1 polyisoprenoid-binding protein [Bordetella bronchiseptica]KCV59629.1 YceI-like domain protein [Bordetella bronchiseptica 99-R-0433]MBN3266519.1 polyisoprenoid-binding protein [Bordetella bronchiseptica]OZI80876.1 polyisoprenoid-binding protein [Bordetella genomosp. 6]
MKKNYAAYLAAALVAMAGLSAQAAPVDYQIDPEHTEVVVTWDHLGFSKPTAHAGGVTGVVRYDAAQPANSAVELSLPVPGLTSHVPKLDEMLQGAQFFEAAKYPDIRFKSTSVTDRGDGRLQIDGILRIKGIDKPVVLQARRNKQGMHPMAQRPAVGFDATTTLKRSDFGVDAFAPDVSDEVQLRITIEALAEAAR